jgi:hypothetical protein
LGLHLPSATSYIFEVRGGFAGHVNDTDRARFLARAVNRLLPASEKSSFKLALKDNDEMELIGLNCPSCFTLAGASNKPNSLISFSMALAERRNLSITELVVQRSNISQYANQVADWENPLFSSVSECLPLVQALHVDFSLAAPVFQQWREGEGSHMFANVHELHIPRGHLDIDGLEDRNFVQAITSRNVLAADSSLVQAIKRIYFHAPSSVPSSIRNSLGDGIEVFLEDVPLHMTDPEDDEEEWTI